MSARGSVKKMRAEISALEAEKHRHLTLIAKLTRDLLVARHALFQATEPREHTASKPEATT